MHQTACVAVSGNRVSDLLPQQLLLVEAQLQKFRVFRIFRVFRVFRVFRGLKTSRTLRESLTIYFYLNNSCEDEVMEGCKKCPQIFTNFHKSDLWR